MTKRDSLFSSFSCIAPRNDEKGLSLFVIKREVAIGRPDRHHAIEIAYSHRTTASGQHFVRIRRLAVGPRSSTPPPRRKRPAPGLPGAGLSTCEGKRPLLAGGVLLSHGLHRSTIGARGLNFRVRDGTGCASPAMAAGQQGAFSSAGPARPCPQGRTALESSSRAGTATACPPRAGGRGNRVRARTISTARLSGSPHLRLRPIQQVVCLCPYQKEDSSREGLPA